MITVSVPREEIDRLAAVLNKISGELKKSSASILRQAMIFAVQSAAKATGPGTRTPAKLQDKYKYRPIERYRTDPPLYINKDTGYMFSSDKKPRRGNVRSVNRAFKYWNKSKGQFDFKPYTGTGTKKYDKESKFGRIPHAGAAKAGWLKALNRLPGGPGYGDTGTGNAQPIVAENRSLTQHQIMVRNIIRYAGAISPNAASQGISSATSRMIGSYRKKIAELDKYKA